MYGCTCNRGTVRMEPLKLCVEVTLLALPLGQRRFWALSERGTSTRGTGLAAYAQRSIYIKERLKYGPASGYLILSAEARTQGLGLGEAAAPEARPTETKPPRAMPAQGRRKQQ